MLLREITLEEFTSFVTSSPLGTHYQTVNYAWLMGEYGYDYEFIGFVNEYGQVKAASLILLKKSKYGFKFGYAPKGFILDYFNTTLLQEFTANLIAYYKKKHVVFIKLNPEIAISEVDPKTGLKTYNWNYEIKDILDDAGYVKLKDNVYFESILPRFQAIVSLKNFSMNSLSKNSRNKVHKSMQKGLHLEIAERSGIDILEKFIAKKRHTAEFYYKDYYNIFKKNDMIDLFLVSIDSEEFLLNARHQYETELEMNNRLHTAIEGVTTQKSINKKMESDRKLTAYKNNVQLATSLNKRKDKLYIAGALVIKYQNRIQILISGYDKKYKNFDANYFLHYAILDYYKNDYDYADLNGMTGDFSKDNPYHGLNAFKLGFHPRVYEYIGEYDLAIKPMKYKKLRLNGNLAKEFNKTDIKVIKKKEGKDLHD